MRTLRLALAQINPTVGDLRGNALSVRKWLAKAETAKADLAVFPELALTGDPPAAGATIPREAGIVHSIDPATKIMGLSAGSHTFTVVLGNGTHQRIGDAQAKATVQVDGPSVDASAPATVFTKAELLQEVWGYQSVGKTRTLDSHASRLRRKLDPERGRFVVNVWGVGYKLVEGP